MEKFLAERILDPYMPQIEEIFTAALNEFQTKHFDPDFLGRTNANIINNLITKHAKKILISDSGIRFRYERGALYMIIHDKMIAKFKKLNDNLLTSNIKTKSVTRFRNQELILNLPNIPPPLTNIFLGYQWDSLNKCYSSLYVTCPSGATKNAWTIAIEPAITTTLPIIPANPAPAAPKKSRVAPKRGIEHEPVINK